jgi:hypothetical protein
MVMTHPTQSGQARGRPLHLNTYKIAKSTVFLISLSPPSQQRVLSNSRRLYEHYIYIWSLQVNSFGLFASLFLPVSYILNGCPILFPLQTLTSISTGLAPPYVRRPRLGWSIFVTSDGFYQTMPKTLEGIAVMEWYRKGMLCCCEPPRRTLPSI